MPNGFWEERRRRVDPRGEREAALWRHWSIVIGHSCPPSAVQDVSPAAKQWPDRQKGAGLAQELAERVEVFAGQCVCYEILQSLGAVNLI